MSVRRSVALGIAFLILAVTVYNTLSRYGLLMGCVLLAVGALLALGYSWLVR
ncbi:MAG TPA: hypothetical protein VKX46_09560 [Ktedonobacteraceae bacterium]|jgi:hypothetical protein|nr:hypothetical protein [Ktedonobacteraceae bacterium]